jgi:N-acetylmuramoyl-L-alanine amidase
VLLFLILLWGVAHAPLLVSAHGYSLQTVLAWGLPDSPKELEDGQPSLNMALISLTGVDPGYLPGILRSGLADTNQMPLPGAGKTTTLASAQDVAHPPVEASSPSANTPHFSQQPVAGPNSRGSRGVLAGKIVVLDPGHGGNDPGTIGPDGIEEKQVTLPIAAVAAQILRQEGAEVIMTRTGDTNPSLYARPDIANRTGANVFVSIHGNHDQSSVIGGTGTYVQAPFPYLFLEQNLDASLKLASCLQDTLVATLRLHNRGIFDDNLEVLRDSQMPAALVEVGFLSNSREERLLNEPSFQQKAGAAIATGITRFLTSE